MFGPISIDCPPVLAMEIIQKRSPILRQVCRPILALPFFDDQYYNAAALVEAGCALRIAKRPVEAQQVPGAGAKLPDEWGIGCWSLGLDIVYIYIFIFIY